MTRIPACIRFRSPAPIRCRQNGQLTLIAGVSLVVLIGFVGLGVDGGRGYMTKARLNAAVDSAAIAAARAVSQGDTQADQTANARTAATNFFNANFPQGYLGSTATLATPSVVFQQGQVTIGVSATAIQPNTFMKVLGLQNVNVAAASTSQRKDLDMMFVIDASSSMNPVWSTVRSNANTFLDQFNPTTDRVGLVHFATGGQTDIAIRTSARGFDRATMKTTITGLANGGTTNYVEPLWQARDQLNGIPQLKRSSLRVIIFFSDGRPNTLGAKYQLKNGITCAGSVAASQTNRPSGYYVPNAINTVMPGGCNGGDLSGNVLPSKMPAYYDVHDDTDADLLIAGTGGVSRPLPVTTSANSAGTLGANVYNASYNVALSMATKIRKSNIYIFTLGLDGNGGFDDALLKSMANTPDATTYDASQPKGVYCYAKTINNLAPCFATLASEILRITQ